MSLGNSKFVKVAFFDIDGTIRNKSLMETFVDFLYGLGHVTPAAYADLRAKRNDYKAARDNPKLYEEYILLVNRILLNAIKNRPLEEVRKLAAQAIAKYHYENYRYTQRLIEVLRANDYKVIAISGSLEFLVDAFKEFYGFDQAYGHGFSVDKNNVYTATEPITWKDKHLIINQIIKDNDWEGSEIQSFAVGDTAGDYTMLREATYAVAINPPSQLIEKLYASAIKDKRDYYCIAERKDSLQRYIIGPNSSMEDGVLKTSDSIILLDAKKLGIPILDDPEKFEDLELITT